MKQSEANMAKALTGLEGVAVLAKAQVKAHTRKDGTFVAAYSTKRQAAAPKPGGKTAAATGTDHGTMVFKHASGIQVRVSPKRIQVLSGGGVQVGHSTLARFTGASGSNADRDRAVVQGLRQAYNESGGDPQKMLAGLKQHATAHNAGGWSLLSHDKPGAKKGSND